MSHVFHNGNMLCISQTDFCNYVLTCAFLLELVIMCVMVMTFGDFNFRLVNSLNRNRKNSHLVLT